MSLFFLLAPAPVADPLTLSITDNTMNGFDSGFNPTGLVTTSSPTTTTVSVTGGGTGSYTYAWTLISGAADSGPFTCTNPTGAQTAWNATCDTSDIDSDETWQCLVTDTGNAKTATITCTVTLSWSDLS